MSRPKHEWYGFIRMKISRYKSETEKTMQNAIFSNAIADAMEETAKLPNGDLRLKAVSEILIRKTKTYEGMAQELHYDYRTIQNWINSFVNLVGKKAGY